jgi:hypothetical protein
MCHPKSLGNYAATVTIKSADVGLNQRFLKTAEEVFWLAGTPG